MTAIIRNIIAKKKAAVGYLKQRGCRRVYKSRKARKGFWRMGSGELIRIRDMSDRHLVNTLCLLGRYAETYWHEQLRVLQSIDNLVSGDIASFLIDQDLNKHLESDPIETMPDGGEKYFELLAEYKRRGLSELIYDN